MALTCDWGQTPAYSILKPLWDSKADMKEQRPIVQLLDGLMEVSMWVPNICMVHMSTYMPSITDKTVAEVYGRMRTWETFHETCMFRNVGEYDPSTDTYTEPEEPKRGYPLSPWVLSQFVGFRTNWDSMTRVKWVTHNRKAGDEFGRFTIKWVNDTIDMYAQAYVDSMATEAVAV
jgi:hypothetical protein